MKHQFSEFKVEVADVDGEPCTNNDGITIIAEVTSIADGVTVTGKVVSETPAVYRVSYQPIKCGEHKINVKVNGTHINRSPFAIFVHNNPHPKKCKAIGEQVESAQKNNPAKFMVQLADEDGDPCVTTQEVTIELKAVVNGFITEGSVVSKTPATYEASYQPRRSGRHELSVKVNGMPIKGSPFAIFVHNKPHPKKCKAIGEQIEYAQKNNPAKFIVQLADEDGDPCVTTQEVTAELKSLMDGSIINAAILSQTPATYEVAYQPSKSGEHEVIVKVNGMEINGSPFALLVHSIPDPQNCKAVGEGISKAEKHKTSEFMVQLADAEGDPCVTKQEVVVELKSLVDGSITKANVVSKTPATYAVSYQPSKIGEHELSVKVNDIHIEGSPFALLVVNIPHTENCKAIGEHVKNAEKNKVARFMIQLADEDSEPCATKQEVTVELKALLNGSISEGSVVSKTPATYEVSYQPRRSGRHELSAKVNGMPIKGSPFAIFVHNKPHPKKCKAIGEQIEYAQKNNPAKFIVQLADEDGDPCVTTQEVTAELKSLMDGSIINAAILSQTPATYEVAYQPSKSGEHKIIVKVNGMEINGSPFALLVHNFPDPKNCKAVGEGITGAEKYKTSEFMVQLADTEGDPCVTKQEVVIELKSLVDGSITKANVVSKTPATYAVSYQPSKSGEHELTVKVNGMHIHHSPFALLVYNIPDPQNCTVVGIVKRAKKHTTFKFNVELADADGEPCVIRHDVTAQLISADDYHYNFIANVTHVSKNIYKVSYRPRKSAEYKLILKVNGREINSSPFDLLVYNIPHPQNCKVKRICYAPCQHISGLVNPVTGHLRMFEQQRTHHSIIVELADKDGEPCITTQKVTAELKSLMDGSIINAAILSQTPANHKVAYQPSKSGEHEIIVKVNGMEINGSPFALFVHNIPDHQNCKAVGKGLTRAEKHKTSEFMVQLADAEGDPCVKVVVELKSLVDGSITKANVVSKTPATYAVSYRPSKSGEHELSVKVNDIHIEGSPFALLVVNIPHTENCKAIGEHVKTAEKNKVARFMIQLADEDSEPCATKQEVTAELKALRLVNGSITEGSVVSKTPATYEVSYQPRRSGRHELSAKVNGMPIKGSPFAIFVHNNPHPNKCKAIGEQVESAQKNNPAKFIVQLADAEGDPCVTTQEVTSELKSLMDGSIINAAIVSQTPATYEVAYQPSKSGKHEVIVKVNGMEINGSPFALLVRNIPEPQNCKAVGERIIKAQKHRTSEFMVQLADAEGDPCVTEQEVVVELKSLVDGSITKANVVSKTPAAYAVSYRLSKCGEHELTVKVNDIHIEGSPFALLAVNKPHTKNCNAIGEHVRTAEKGKVATFLVKLVDADGEPCVSKQEVTIELKSRVNSSSTEGRVVSKTPATYEVSYQPKRSGSHKLSVKVNGMEINGSPFALLVHNIPDPQNCKAVGKGVQLITAEKHKTIKFIVELADAEGDLCATKQEVVVELKSLMDGSITKADVVHITPAIYAVSFQPSKSREHKIIVKVNGMEINGSPFALFVHNIPDPQNCKAVGKRITKAEKHKTSEFIAKLADSEGDPCVAKQEVVVDLKSLVDGSITKANVVRETPATYAVSYQPRKSGEHKLRVKVNGMHIDGSPFAVLVYNIPGPQNCKAVGIVKSVKKHIPLKFNVILADAEGERCVTRQNVTVQLKSLVDGSVTNAYVDSETPATYAVFCHTSKIGEHELSVKVNGVHIHGSPFAVLVYNTPDPQNCKAVGVVKSVKVYEAFNFIVKLAGVEGEPCFTRQDVTAQLISADDYHYRFNASVINVSKNIYVVSCQPRKCAEYILIVKVNGREINSSPFDLLVYNTPHLQNCEVKIVSYVLPAVVCQQGYGHFVVPGMVRDCASRRMHPPPQQPRTHHSIIVELADADGEPWITTQEVTATMEDEHSLHRCEVHSEGPAIYRVFNPKCPIGRYILTAYVNGMAISIPLRINLGELNWVEYYDTR